MSALPPGATVAMVRLLTVDGLRLLRRALEQEFGPGLAVTYPDDVWMVVKMPPCPQCGGKTKHLKQCETNR